jgi:hypothetical protein
MDINTQGIKPELVPLHEELIREVQYLSKTLEECDKLLEKLRSDNQKLKSNIINCRICLLSEGIDNRTG